jgi:hypothetical protein
MTVNSTLDGACRPGVELTVHVTVNSTLILCRSSNDAFAAPAALPSRRLQPARADGFERQPLAALNRFATSSQLTVFHHASM